MLVKTLSGALLLSTLTLSLQAHAAIALDRTRVIFNGNEKNVSLNISNENNQLPYLAQGWIEDSSGKKITSPLVLLPPVQRVEPGERSVVKVQSLPAIKSLPQDRESVFYFSMREIPPRSEKSNVLQIALQTAYQAVLSPGSDRGEQSVGGDAMAGKTDADAPGCTLPAQQSHALLHYAGGCTASERPVTEEKL